ASPFVPILDGIDSYLRSSPEKWDVFNRTNARVDFLPKSWRKWLPPIAYRQGDPQLWLVIFAAADRKRCRLQIVAWNTTNSQSRAEFLSRVTAPEAPFKLNRISQNDKSRTNTLLTLKVMNWQEDSIPEDPLSVVDAFAKAIDKLERQLTGFDEFAATS